jgi:hypothetical protein
MYAGERRSDADHRTIGIGDMNPFPKPRFFRCLDQTKMFVIDLVSKAARPHHAIARRIADQWIARTRKRLFRFALHSTAGSKHDIAIKRRFDRRNLDSASVFGNCPRKFHAQASAHSLPAERSDAANADISNCG